jgi:two-component system nitrate/nitrite response regulator NarL
MKTPRIVILTAFAEDEDVLAAVNHGVHGIIMKDSAAGALISCLRRVSAGYRCVPPELQRLTETNFISQLLTSREREVMCLVAEGLSNKNVASQLNISEGTVKLHLHHIYCKTGVNSRSTLMTFALRLGGTRVNHKLVVTESPSFVGF